jgi:hypothetical protein
MRIAMVARREQALPTKHALRRSAACAGSLPPDLVILAGRSPLRRSPSLRAPRKSAGNVGRAESASLLFKEQLASRFSRSFLLANLRASNRR